MADFTKALDELRRVKEFLSAVAISEETMLQVAKLGDDVAALSKLKDELRASISSLSETFSKAQAVHNREMSKLSTERSFAQESLDAIKKEIAASKKAYGAEAESFAGAIRDAKKHNAIEMAKMNDALIAEQAKVDAVRETLKRISGLTV
jgi:chromosome segregation ATPase